ncbi:hypothetical protein J2Z83_002346 [Virgibacillus natechei]|uniref:DUF2512 family protein n=1 Tax=Virgibacillus natechei TaxID=1216297 RepID=A0ABS4IGZ7_9BACI|nr:YndM family protein [Virgibacillus natechei]MBP1970228.1 hypothetical protein [Virgibacillus natechei]UZD12824.1 YndM family protein [Virgibacillus natechei]
MNHFRLFAVKFIGSLLLLYLILSFGYGVTFGSVFLITLVLSLSYIGDAFLLPRLNNTLGTIGDFVFAFLVIYFMGVGLTTGMEWFTASLIAAIGIGVFEYFFHKYVQNEFDDAHKNERTPNRNLEAQTEASKETHPFNSEYLDVDPEDFDRR